MCFPQDELSHNFELLLLLRFDEWLLLNCLVLRVFTFIELMVEMGKASQLVELYVVPDLGLKQQLVPVLQKDLREVGSPQVGSRKNEPLVIRVPLAYSAEFLAIDFKNHSLVLSDPIEGLDSGCLDAQLVGRVCPN